jgi:hypothetical protein
MAPSVTAPAKAPSAAAAAAKAPAVAPAAAVKAPTLAPAAAKPQPAAPLSAPISAPVAAPTAVQTLDAPIDAAAAPGPSADSQLQGSLLIPADESDYSNLLSHLMDQQKSMLERVHGADSPYVSLASTLADLQGSVRLFKLLMLFICVPLTAERILLCSYMHA